jgi:hypothetical protein
MSRPFRLALLQMHVEAGVTVAVAPICHSQPRAVYNRLALRGGRRQALAGSGNSVER